MIDHDEAKVRVLEDLMEKMREMDGGRLKPKSVELSVESVKPGPGVELHEDPESEGHMEAEEVPAHGLDMHSAQPGLSQEGDHQEPEGDELSPEDLAVLEQLFGGQESKEEEEQC